MMRAVWFTLLVVFLVGCSAAQSPTGEVVASTCMPPNYEYAPGDCCLDSQPNQICDRDEPAATAVPTPAAQPLDPKMAVIPNAIANFQQNVSSYSFKIKKDDYVVRGPLIHVRYGSFDESRSYLYNGTIRTFITDLYVDRETKQLVAYCDPRTEEEIVGEYQADRSKCIKVIDLPFDLDYNKYNPKLPEDILEDYKHREPSLVEDTEQFIKEPSGWKAVNPIVHFGDDTNEIILRLDAKTGLPLRMETRKGELTTTTGYEFFVHNRVKPEETVYKPFAR